MRHRIVSRTYALLFLLAVVSVPVGVVAAEGAAVSAETNETISLNETGPEIDAVQATQAVDHGPNGTMFVWERASGYEIATTVDSPSEHTAVCLHANGTTTCTSAEANGTTNISTPGTDGLDSLSVSLYNTSSNDTLDTQTVSLQPVQRTGDLDDDGLNNGNEIAQGSTLTTADSDGDGLADGTEVHTHGTDPTVADTDEDGITDGAELSHGTDPTLTDTDGDGTGDERELEIGTNPSATDTDSDGLTDQREVSGSTDPSAADTDGDFLRDQQEVTWGTDPNSALTPAWVTSSLVGFIIGIGVTISAISRGWVTDLTASVRLLCYRLLELDREIIEVNREIEAADDEPAADGVAPIAETATDVFEQADTEFMPDERIVKLMLRAESGRLHQSDIVEATDWSKAKVSRLLSSMADTDDIVKIRLGRENLICLERAEPAAAKSPQTADEHPPPTPGG